MEWPRGIEGHVGSLTSGGSADIRDIDLAGDHLVPELRDNRRELGQPVPSLVRDQNSQMLDLTELPREAHLPHKVLTETDLPYSRRSDPVADRPAAVATSKCA